MNSANTTGKLGQAVGRKINGVLEFRVDERAVAANMRDEIKSMLPKLNTKPGEPNPDKLKETAYILASLKDRKIDPIAVIIVRAVGDECVEKEVQLYDKYNKLLAIAVWTPDTGISFTRIH